MFELGSDDLQGYADEILHSLAPVLNDMPNRLSIVGHTDGRPFGRPGRSNWELSSERANTARRTLQQYGYSEDKVLRVIGMAAALPFVDEDPLDPQNRRISMTVMKESATRRILKPTSDSGLDARQMLEDAAGPPGGSEGDANPATMVEQGPSDGDTAAPGVSTP